MSPYFPPLIAFLAGSIPFGLITARLKGVDIRKHGSGNIGATNVLRVLGKPYGITVFVLDFLKGLLPVLLANYTCELPAVSVAAALAAILGHNYSPWIGFRGGKGVATSAGALLGLFPIPLIIAFSFWGLLLVTTRYVSVASIGAALAIPICVGLNDWFHGGVEPLHLGFALLIATLAIWRHRSNIQNLRNGTESRFSRRRSSNDSSSNDSTS